jgi:hypothetical protein
LEPLLGRLSLPRCPGWSAARWPTIKAAVKILNPQPINFHLHQNIITFPSFCFSALNRRQLYTSMDIYFYELSILLRALKLFLGASDACLASIFCLPLLRCQSLCWGCRLYEAGPVV